MSHICTLAVKLLIGVTFWPTHACTIPLADGFSQIDLGEEEAVHEYKSDDLGVDRNTFLLCQKHLLVVVHMARDDVNRLGNCIECPLPSLLHHLRPNVKPLLHCLGVCVAQNIHIIHGQRLVEHLDLPSLRIGLLALP